MCLLLLSIRVCLLVITLTTKQLATSLFLHKEKKNKSKSNDERHGIVEGGGVTHSTYQVLNLYEAACVERASLLLLDPRQKSKVIDMGPGMVECKWNGGLSLSILTRRAETGYQDGLRELRCNTPPPSSACAWY